MSRCLFGSALTDWLHQVLLARHKESTQYYAVKVLQKKIILKKKEVRFKRLGMFAVAAEPVLRTERITHPLPPLPAKAHHG